MLPDDARTRAARMGPFLYALTEKLNAKEKQALIKAAEMTKADVDPWQKLEAARQEAGNGAAVAAHPQGFAGLSDRYRGGAGRGAVPALPLGR